MLRNDTDISLLMAVWLAATNGYDLVPAPKLISATSLIDPLKSTILSGRASAIAASAGQAEGDVIDALPSKVGTAVHEAVEYAWLNHYEEAMKILGYPEHVIAETKVNPAPGGEGKHNIYLELRTNKPLAGWTISGKFDAVVLGQLCDIKNTKVFTYVKGTNNEKWALQGSIYRWLRPDIITEDSVQIEYVFSDWNEYDLKKLNYPPKKIMSFRIPLHSIQDTERWIIQRTKELDAMATLPQDQMNPCTPKEIWQSAARYAYYSRTGLVKATKIYDNQSEANDRVALKGGYVDVRRGIPKFCNYCGGKSICEQRQGFVRAGLLK